MYCTEDHSCSCTALVTFWFALLLLAKVLLSTDLDPIQTLNKNRCNNVFFQDGLGEVKGTNNSPPDKSRYRMVNIGNQQCGLDPG